MLTRRILLLTLDERVKILPTRELSALMGDMGLLNRNAGGGRAPPLSGQKDEYLLLNCLMPFDGPSGPCINATDTIYI